MRLLFLTAALMAWATPLYADEPAPLRLRILSFDRGPGEEFITVRLRGRDARIPVERVNLNRADLFTLRAVSGRRLPVLELVNGGAMPVAIHEGAPRSAEAWVRSQLETRSESEIDWAPPVRTLATGEWSRHEEESLTARPTSPLAIPERHRWIFEEAVHEAVVQSATAGGT
jgi:hypothetical protein